MNLDANDIELIKQTVKAAIADADVVKGEDFKQFRAEVLIAQEQFVRREVLDLMLAQRDADRARMWEEIKASKNALASLWENVWVKVGLVAGVALQAYELWRIFQ